MFERRKRNRFIERNEVLLRTSVDKYQGPGIAAHTYDLSTGGARIVTSKSYPVGTVIRIRLNLAGSDEVVNLDGEVKWLRQKEHEDAYEIGVDFELQRVLEAPDLERDREDVVFVVDAARHRTF